VSSPFDSDFGTSQGRIEPTDGPTFEGSWLYQLGHDLRGQFRNFADGDGHQIDQSATPTTGTRVVRLRARIDPPAAMPSDASWQVQVSVDGTVNATVPIRPGGVVRTVIDLAMNVGTAVVGSGAHNVALRLLFSGSSGVAYTAELPGVAVDALIEDPTVAAPGVCNRDPEPGESSAPVPSKLTLASISFTLYDTEGDTLDLTRTTVTVNGVPVYTGGAFASGWTSSTTSSITGMNATLFTLTPSVALLPDTTYTVTLMSAVVGGPVNALDTSWSFTTIDTTAPTVISAMALDPSNVLVVFSKDMLEVDETGTADALDPSNYTISLVSGAPAIVPQVASVAPGATSSSAILTTTDPLTAGAVYEVSVGPTVTDSLGNLIANAPGNAVSFVWAGCPVPVGRDPNMLWNLLPQGARTADVTGDLRNFIACMQVVFGELLCDVDAWSSILDPDTAPAPFVAAMLDDLGNPFGEFSDALDLTQQRQLVRLLPILYGLKGTDVGMIDAIQLFTGVTVTISCPSWQGCWHLDVDELGETTILGSNVPRDLYKLYVVSPVVLTAAQVTAIEAIVAYMRRAPTHLAGIIEPTPPPPTPDHWELGLSDLDTQALLH
jgi:phage tail-like protein